MLRCGWRGSAWTVALAIAQCSGWAQTKAATVELKPYGVMTQPELDKMHPLDDPRPQYKDYVASGPPGGVAWRGVGALAVDDRGMVYVGLPIWATGYAPKNSVRGTSDKLRVLVVSAEADGRVERTMDFPTQSLNRLDLRLAAGGKLLVLAGDKLIRIGGDGRRSAQLDIPNEEKEFEIWDVESSTTGGTLRVRLNNTHTMMVDSKTLTVVKQCRDAKDTSDEGTMTDDMELSSQVKTGLPNITYRIERQRFLREERADGKV